MASKSAAQQIVHESETQRQHVRVQIPARAEIDGQVYDVKDLSVSGISVDNVAGSFKQGQQFAFVLSVPFESFSLNVSLKAFVTHFDTAQKRLGCQFTDLTREQLSILNAIIQSYMSGVIIKEGDLLNVVARDNFVKIRKEIQKEEAHDTKAILKRALPFLFMACAALLGGFFVTGNVYEKLLILKSYQASVRSESFVMRSSAAGIFKATLPDNTERVSKGQVLGSLEGSAIVPAVTPGAAPTVTPVTTSITSPCDCYILQQYVQDGVFRNLGEPVFELVRVEAKPVVKATIAAEDVVRVNLRDKALVRITGEEEAVTGIITEIEAADASATASLVTIRPEKPLSYKLSDRPAYVEIFVK